MQGNEHNNQHLTLLGKVFSFAEIKKEIPLREDKYVQQILIFCHNWLNGQEEFKLYTSGSTGTPKEIIILRAQMQYSAQLTAEALNLNKNDSAFCCLNCDYIAGKMMLVRAMVIGMDIEVVKPSSQPITATTKHFDFIALVPMQVQVILGSNHLSKLNKAKSIIIGGAVISKHLETLIKKKISPITYQTYGMTETVSHIALREIGETNTYTTLRGIGIQTLSNQHLMIKSKLTLDKWITTNDIVDLISGNEFIWLGRSDFIINSGGVKIHPEQLESQLGNLGLINTRFFFSSIPDPQLGEALVLYIEGEEQDLSQYINQLAKYHQPKKVFFIPEFYETLTGKVDKKEVVKAINFKGEQKNSKKVFKG